MNKLVKRGALGFTAVAVAAALVAAPAVAANAAIVPTVGSAHPVYLLSDQDGTQIPAGSSLGWNDSVLASPDASDEDWNSAFAVPSGTGTVQTFISPRGQESNRSAWNAYGPLGLTPNGIQLANLKPSANTSAGLGSPTGSGGVANAGGDYSLGIAFSNGNQMLEVNFTYITVVANANANLATWTFATPVTDTSVAPAITTQPTNASVNPGATATFAAAASGTPMPTVQWQSSTNGTSWADLSGATSASLSVANATVSQSGTQYRAVFTNSKGSATSAAATLTVSRVAPDQPSGSAANLVTIPAPAQGATTVTVPAGASHANGTLQAWAWSDPTNLGQVPTDASGNATVPITGLPAGTHTIALTQPGDATFAIVAWGTIQIQSQAGDPATSAVDVKATVTASDLWSLSAEKTAIDFGNVRRNASVTRSLGKVTVVDDRNVLKGWSLGAAWSKFTAGTDEIGTDALTVAPKAYTGSTPISGVTLGTTGSKIAESTAVSTLATGALFDADLTFTAPKDAKVGEYHSTLTLTLTSK